MRRAHDPSGLGRRRLGLRRHPQHNAGDVRSLRGQRQFAAGDEIELSRLAPDFQHDNANCIAGQRVGSRPQCVVHIGGAHGHEKAWIKTEFGQSAHRHRARFNLGEILPYPHQWPPACRPARKGSSETGRRSALPAGLRKHFMHGSQGKAALQRRVGIRMPKRHLPRRIRFPMRLDALDPAAQNCKRAFSHTPSLMDGPLPGLQRKNQRWAYLFMICSNIKLTWAEESIGLPEDFFEIISVSYKELQAAA
jgi:hypothetical protein